MRSQPRSFWCLVVLVWFLPLSTSTPASAGQGVININQHQVPDDGSTCTPCPEDVTDVPFPSLAQDPDNEISAFSYHVNAHNGDPLVGRYCKAVCKYSYFDRPKIISTDWSSINNSQASTWLQKVCADDDLDSNKKGRLHFEHFEPALENSAADVSECIAGYSSWTWQSGKAQQMLRYFSDADKNCGDVLSPNGTLKRGDDALPQGHLNLLYWRTPGIAPPDDLAPVTLTGFGFMGPVAMGDRLDTLAFLRSLRRPYYDSSYHHGANLIRIWAPDQWAAQAPDEHGTCFTPNQTVGPVPFEGVLEPDGYSLDRMSPRFFSQLRKFVQAAADRGIVVQYTLFDKHGLLRRTGAPLEWDSSPYNADKNDSAGNYLSPPYPEPACPACPSEGPVEDPTLCEPCEPHPDFVNGNIGLAQDHRLLMARSAQEIGGIGNVMFEVINEAIAGFDWQGQNQGWQDIIAHDLRMQLPTFVARDAFNAETSNVALSQKPPDAGGGAWDASNARVIRSQEAGTLIWMGTVKPYASSSVNYMRGSLPIGTGAPRTALSVRANVNRMGNSMELGVSSTSDATSAGLIRVEVGPAVILVPGSRVAIVKELGGNRFELASTWTPVLGGDDLRIYVDFEAATATVFVNSKVVPNLENVALGTVPTGLAYAYFRGSKSSGYYVLGDGEIDNFEADVFCTNEDPPYNCVP